MKTRMFQIRAKSLVSVLLATVLLFSALPLLTSCGSEAALELDGVEIDEDLYRYWLCSFKNYFLTTYSDIEDTEESWSKEMNNGKTVAQYVEEYTLNYAKNALCVLKLYKEEGLSLSSEDKAQIEEYIAEVIEYQYDGNRADFNAALLETYGITVDQLQEAYEIEAKITQLQEHLFGEGGELALTAEDLEEYYNRHYLRIKVVYVNTVFSYVTDENGKYETDPDTGYYKIVSLDETAKAEKLAKVQEALDRLNNGESMDDIIAAYSEIQVSENQADGFTFPDSAYTTMLGSGYSASALQTIYQMEENTVLSITDEDLNTNYPGCFIVQRLPLLKGDYLDSDGNLKDDYADLETYAANERYNALLADAMEEIVLNEDCIGGLSVQNVNRGLSFLT